MSEDRRIELIHSDDWKALKHLIGEKAALNSPTLIRDGFKVSMLQFAAADGALAVTEGLLNAGAHIDAANRNRTPLCWALSSHQLTIVRVLLKSGANPNIPCLAEVDEAGQWTSLLSATYRNNEESVKMLLEHGADPSFVSTKGIGCITCAADRRNYELVKLLLQAGAPPLGNALFCAIERQDEDILKLLLEAGCNPNVQAHDTELASVEKGQTPLMYALGRFDVVRSLASLRYQDEQCRYGKEKSILINMIAKLLEAGADPNAVCDTRTPLSTAILTRELELVKMLLGKGADPIGKCFSPFVEFKDRGGDKYGFYETALHTAVKEGTYPIIAELLKAGADPLWRDHAGVSILELIHDTLDNDMRALFMPWLSKLKPSDR